MSLRFQDQFLKKLEYLQVVSRREFAGRNRADRRTPKKGRGIEFADHRQYARGDDFRHIDWKAYKRVNRLLLRLFEEEQDLPIYLILDVSGSMAPYSRALLLFAHAAMASGARVEVFSSERGSPA